MLRVGDANDLERIEDALAVFRKTKGRPTLIILDSHIGYGSPHKVDTAAAHGEPLGRGRGPARQARLWLAGGCQVPGARRRAASISTPASARAAPRRGERWEALFADYREQFPELATEIDQMQRRELPAGWDRNLPSFPADPKGIAGRDASGKVLNVLAQNIPWFLGGSADLGPSNKTTLKFAGAGDFEPRQSRRPQSAFRHPRARHGGDRQRPVAVEAAGLRRDLLHLQRLCAAGHPALRADGAADHLRLHP